MSENKREQQTIPPMGGRGGGFGGGRGMQIGGAKAKDFKGTWVKLIKYSKRFMPFIILALVFAAGGAILQIIGPEYLSRLTDEIGNIFIIGSIDMSVVLNIGLILICFYSGSLVLRLADNLIMAKVTQKISQKMRSDISGKINRLPLGYFHKTSYGDVLSRVTNDVDAIGQTLNQSID
ncbi:MAG: ABC transporter transmembrane domain-containing protein, partial [Firmicutes bacterium]|nr:ABC transporter transmembrane domain-containing protein [Bacillota bacterium]